MSINYLSAKEALKITKRSLETKREREAAEKARLERLQEEQRLHLLTSVVPEYMKSILDHVGQKAKEGESYQAYALDHYDKAGKTVADSLEDQLKKLGYTITRSERSILYSNDTHTQYTLHIKWGEELNCEICGLEYCHGHSGEGFQ